MDPKLLTESGWSTVAVKFKVKDKDLQRALSVYESIDQDEYEDRLKELTNIGRLSLALKRDKEVSSLPGVVKYLGELVSAVESERKQIESTVAKERAEAKKKESQPKQDSNDDEDEEAADYPGRLLAAFQKLKGAKGLSFEFIVCDATPHCGLMVAKRITPKHKEELSKVTGGSKRFLHVGRCQFEDGRFTFMTEQPVSGLARKLQDSIKNFTNRALPIKVGSEIVEGKEEQSTGAQVSAGSAPRPSPVPSPRTGHATLEKAPEVWHSTRAILDARINELKKAIRTEFAGQSPDLIAGIETTVSKLDVILDKLDHRLADSLAKAHAAAEPAARQSELKNSKAILADYIHYVKNEPLIAHIDANPLGIQTNLKHVLTESLTHMAQAIG